MQKKSDSQLKTNLSKSPGTYALVIFLPHRQTIRIGSLGTFEFTRGYYLYIGSAMNGLNTRIARHLANQQMARRAEMTKDIIAIQDWRERKKKIRWHIDYLLEHARVKEIWTHQGTERFECMWAQAALLLPKVQVVAPGFGASDCNCATHLVYFGNRPPQGFLAQ